MSRYRKNSHLLRDRDAETQNRLLGQDVFVLERESPSPFADSPSPVRANGNGNGAHALSPLSVANANPFLDAAESEDEAEYTMAPIPMTNISDSNPRRSADYGASSSTMTSSSALYARGQTTRQPHSQQIQPRRPNTTIKEAAKPKRHQPSANMNYPLPAISTSYTYSSGSSLVTPSSASSASSTSSASSSSASSKSASTGTTTSVTSAISTTSTSTTATSNAADSLTSVVKRRPSPFPLGPVPPPPPPRRKRNEVKPHIVDIAVETFQLDTQIVSKPKPLTASMRRRNPPRIESYEDEEMMVPTPIKPYTLEATPAYARRRRNESESSVAPSAPKSAIQLEREALWKQFEAEQIRSPDITPTSARRSSRIICQEKSITTAPITTFTTATVPTTTTSTTTTSSTTSTEKSEKAKKPKRKWWSCFSGGGVESDLEVVNEKR